MDFMDLVKSSRSVRRFDGAVVPMAELERLVELARYTPSGGNLQQMRYILVNDPRVCEAVFACLAWAAYLPHWPGPGPGERPGGYVVICHDTAVSDNPYCDHGIAAQTMMLGAAGRGLGGCILGSINHDRLRAALDIPGALKVLLVLALGRPAETVVVEDMVPGPGGHKYWRDDQGVHHVPKRPVAELVAACFAAPGRAS